MQRNFQEQWFSSKSHLKHLILRFFWISLELKSSPLLITRSEISIPFLDTCDSHFRRLKTVSKWKNFLEIFYRKKSKYFELVIVDRWFISGSKKSWSDPRKKQNPRKVVPGETSFNPWSVVENHFQRGEYIWIKNWEIMVCSRKYDIIKQIASISPCQSKIYQHPREKMFIAIATTSKHRH